MLVRSNIVANYTVIALFMLIMTTHAIQHTDLEDDEHPLSIQTQYESDIQPLDETVHNWDSDELAAFRNILQQSDGVDRMLFPPRSVRQWAELSPARGENKVLSYYGRMGPKLFKQWRANKRQVDKQIRYRQCYFNPISCFRK